MKTNIGISVNIILLTVILTSFSCMNKNSTDSKEMAEEQNDQKFEDSKMEDDTEFAVNAADAGLLEVKLGELAQVNASSDQVKAFGKMMVTDHNKANAELMALAQQKNITLPLSLSDKCQRDYDNLAKKTGKDFDDAYTDFMVKDHKNDLREFKEEGEDGKDADLKMWAAGKVAILEHHLDMAKKAEEAVDKMK